MKCKVFRNPFCPQTRTHFGADAQKENADERLDYELATVRFYAALFERFRILRGTDTTDEKAGCRREKLYTI